jgi:hypothetical protein
LLDVVLVAQRKLFQLAEVENVGEIATAKN